MPSAAGKQGTGRHGHPHFRGGGMINIRSIDPGDDLGAMLSASYGDIIARGKNMSPPYHRMFGMIRTGVFTPWGTKAWFSASTGLTTAAQYVNIGPPRAITASMVIGF